MKPRTTFELDHSSRLMVINPAFECSIAPGLHAISGTPGEHVFEILGRWLAINFPSLACERVQQTGLQTWACRADGQVIVFNVVL